MSKISVTTLILTFNEELHIGRCLENVVPFSSKVYVIDCFSTDKTCEICRKFPDVEIVQHKWPGSQAEQFNWALDHINIDTDWILRMDADEYLRPELVHEITETLPLLSDHVTGCVIKRDLVFMGKPMRFGKLKTIRLLRLWRTGKGRIENRIMDEHAVVTEGRSVLLKSRFVDDNLNGIEGWVKKHLDYADREVRMLLSQDRMIGPADDTTTTRNRQKSSYYALPAFHRCFWFFLFRYILLGGFLDGKAGFVWHFMQCWWYRTLVDVKLAENNRKR